MRVPSQTLARILRLESAMADLARTVAQTSIEMREFKEESRADRRALREAIAASTASAERDRAEIAASTERQCKEIAASTERQCKEIAASTERQCKEIAASTERQSKEFSASAERDRRDLNRKLGEIANAQGRLIEDIVAPSVPRVLCGLLGLPEDAPIAPSGPRMRLRDPRDRGRVRELDAVAGYGDLGLVVEVKSQLTASEIKRFAASLEDARDLLAPLGIRQVIGAVASVHVDATSVTRASRLGLLALGAGDDVMEIKNAAGFAPRRV